MKPLPLALLIPILVLGLVLVLVLGLGDSQTPGSSIPAISGQPERSLPVQAEPPPTIRAETEVRESPTGLDPEIVTNMQAYTLGNALEQAEHWPDEYARQAGNPRRQDVEDAVMKLVPKLIVEASPRFHLERLTNFSKEFPQDLVSPVRKLWRDALIQQELIRAEKNIWNGAYGQALEEIGVEYTPRSEQVENAIPPLAALNKQLRANRETYLRNLERLFREHGLLDDR